MSTYSDTRPSRKRSLPSAIVGRAEFHHQKSVAYTVTLQYVSDLYWMEFGVEKRYSGVARVCSGTMNSEHSMILRL